jgi:CheY-like chemotaxis protein
MGLLDKLGASVFHRRHTPTERTTATVLIIDDDPVLLESLSELLRQAGHNVLTSPTGQKGLELLRYSANAVDFVLLDFNMPRCDGTQTLAHVRKLNPHTRVIGISGSSASSLPSPFRNGVDRLLQKPLQSSDIFATLHEMASEESNDESEHAPSKAPVVEQPVMSDFEVETERCAKLVAQSILAADEWPQAREKFLKMAPERREEAVVFLRELHSLYVAGIVTKAEFKTKKQVILHRGVAISPTKESEPGSADTP